MAGLFNGVQFINNPLPLPPPLPNLFLLEQNHIHNENCFCRLCRQRCADAIIGPQRVKDYLRNLITHDLPLEREGQSDAVFKTTKQQIVLGKVYKDECLSDNTYRYFKSWAKQEPVYQPLVNGSNKQQKEFKRHCQHINETSYCFENWEKIVSNLTDSRMTYIDARNFSVHYFYLSASIDWCLEYNEKVSPKERSRDGLPYSSAQIDDIFHHIVDSGILQDIEHDPRLAAVIGGQLQRKMTSYCRRHRVRHPDD